MVTFSTGLFICFLNKISDSKFKKNREMLVNESVFILIYH